MPIIGVVGADFVQQLLPDRAKIEAKVQDEWEKYKAKKPRFPPRAEDGSIDREAARREVLRFAGEELMRLNHPESEVRPIERPADLVAAINQLVGRVLSEVESAMPKPVVVVFLDP